MEFNFDNILSNDIRTYNIIGFVCSSFDLLHAGHILMLKEAYFKCSYLVAALQFDTKDREDKNSPIQTYDERYIQLDALKYVNKIIKYETDKDLLKLLQVLKPDIRILGSDWKEREDEIIGKDIAPIFWHDRSGHNYSTTALRNKIFMAETEKRFLEAK